MNNRAFRLKALTRWLQSWTVPWECLLVNIEFETAITFQSVRSVSAMDAKAHKISSGDAVISLKAKTTYLETVQTKYFCFHQRANLWLIGKSVISKTVRFSFTVMYLQLIYSSGYIYQCYLPYHLSRHED